MMNIVTVETGFVWTAAGGSTTVVDNLTTMSATSALSANQGVVLKGLIDNIEQGGDAVTLDGQGGSYYLSRSNHTGTQAPATIAQDASNRFVTDAEKSTWNGKQNALGFTPVATDDARLSDARTPLAHQHAMTDVTGLSAALSDKADASTVTAALSDKVDKEPGKGLSSNDFTTDEKNKLAGLANYDDTAVNAAISALQTDKADTDSVYTKTESDALLAGKAASVHTHEIAQVNGLQSALDAKAASADVYTKTEIDSAMDLKADAADLVPFTGSALPGDISGYPDGKIFIID